MTVKKEDVRRFCDEVEIRRNWMGMLLNRTLSLGDPFMGPEFFTRVSVRTQQVIEQSKEDAEAALLLRKAFVLICCMAELGIWLGFQKSRDGSKGELLVLVEKQLETQLNRDELSAETRASLEQSRSSFAGFNPLTMNPTDLKLWFGRQDELLFHSGFTRPEVRRFRREFARGLTTDQIARRGTSLAKRVRENAYRVLRTDFLLPPETLTLLAQPPSVRESSET